MKGDDTKARGDSPGRSIDEASQTIAAEGPLEQVTSQPSQARGVSQLGLRKTNDRPSMPSAVSHVDEGIVEAPFAERYEERRLLGAGGMGEVLLIKDRRIGRDVAMKVMRPAEHGTVTSLRTRFLREARIQAQLEHPAIVPVYEMGLTPDGTEYFTMKRVEGETLAVILQRLRRGDEETLAEHPRNKLLGAFRQVCLAIEYAHRRGVIHRDLKLQNIMFGELGEVYLIDWGLAKLKDPDEEPLPGEAGSAAIVGSPGYMAPEQCRGEALDERADVYALGAALFELLALEPLHQEDSVLALVESTTDGVDVHARLKDTDVPPELAALVEQATRPDRDERLPSAQALADGIQRFLDGDRDAELRAGMAEEHLSAAEQAAARARAGEGDPLAHHQRALQEAGRALALAPTSDRAAGLLMELLVEPPREVPDEVEEAVRQEEDDEVRVTAQQAAPAYFMNGCVAIAAGLLLGIQNVAWIVAIVVPQWITAALCFWTARRMTRVTPHLMIIAAISFVAIGADAGFAGPLILVPGYAAANMIALSLPGLRNYRAVLLTLAALSILVPLGLEYTGWIEPAYTFLEEGILVRPRAVNLPPLILPLGILAAILTAMVGPMVVTWRKGDALTETRRKVHLQSWMLRQMVPRRAAELG